MFFPSRHGKVGSFCPPSETRLVLRLVFTSRVLWKWGCVTAEAGPREICSSCLCHLECFPLGASHHHIRSLTTLRPPCGEEAQVSMRKERGPMEEAWGISHASKAFLDPPAQPGPDEHGWVSDPSWSHSEQKYPAELCLNSCLMESWANKINVVLSHYVLSSFLYNYS